MVTNNDVTNTWESTIWIPLQEVYRLLKFSDCSLSITGDTKIFQSQRSSHILFKQSNTEICYFPKGYPENFLTKKKNVEPILFIKPKNKNQNIFFKS